MAQIFELRSWGTTINLINASGWHLLDPGWVPKVTFDDQPVREVIRIYSNFATQDALAAALIALNKIRLNAQNYMSDPTERREVWLHDQLSSESNQRRTFIRRMAISPLTESHGTGPEGDMIGAQPYYTLTIEREPYWEVPSSGFASTTDLSCLGGAYDYADAAGDAPARLDYLRIGSSRVTGYEEMYLGFRSANKHDTLANFQPLWEVENGTNGTDASDAVDATASGGDKVTVSFATQTGWYWRSSMAASTYAGGNMGDQLGQFVLLLRAKVDAGTTEAWVRAGHLYLDGNTIAYGDVVKVDATAWTVYNLGLLTIPLRNLQAITEDTIAASYDGSQRIRLYARRESAGGTLDLDCLILIPADEFFIHFDKASMGRSSTRFTYVGMSPVGTIAIYAVDMTGTGMAFSVGRKDSVGDGVPVGDGRLYGVLLRANSQNILADDWDPGIKLWSRYATLRGNT